jgi:hypothetical protein
MGFVRKIQEMIMDKPVKSAVIFFIGYVVGYLFPFVGF